jgi:hypothetical protein
LNPVRCCRRKTATNSVNERWRRENAAAIAAVEASAEFKAALAATPQRVRTLGSKDLGELKDMCAQMRHALISKSVTVSG